ncbi:hypothetical protein ACQJBY_018042 [Aegilops geniculata]
MQGKLEAQNRLSCRSDCSSVVPICSYFVAEFVYTRPICRTCCPTFFVGVNNHFQSIILAGFFMRVEQVESLEWVFSEFLNTMGRLVPKSIVTDQNRVMEVAISKVYPGK